MKKILQSFINLKNAIIKNWNLQTFVFVSCSFISAFINIVFISNLSKSDYTIGTMLSLPAAILLGGLSISLDLAKILHVVKVNTLEELHRTLDGKYSFSYRFKKLRNKWNGVYILYVVLSIITSVSLSTISIGSGISRNANTIKQIDSQIAQGEVYYNIFNTSNSIDFQSKVAKATDNTEQNAVNYVREQVEKVWPIIEEYIEERSEFENTYGVEAVSSSKKIEEWKNEIPSRYWDKRNNEVNKVIASSGYSRSKLTGTQIKNITKINFESKIRSNYLSTYKTVENDKAIAGLKDLKTSNEEEAYSWIEELNNLGLQQPGKWIKNGKKQEWSEGEIISFDINRDKSAKVLVSSALTRLKALKVDIQNDQGDIGSSSKIFIQLGSMFRKNEDVELNDAVKKKNSTSFGATEIMMMGMLLFLSLLCELAINQCSPRTPITRSTIDEFAQYFPADFDIDDFMMDVLIRKLKLGEISKKDFDVQISQCIEMRGITKESLLLKKENKKDLKDYKERVNELTQNKVDNEYKIQQLEKELETIKNKNALLETKLSKKKTTKVKIPLPGKTITITDVPEEEKPVEEIKQTEPKKMVVKSAEKELAEMINGGL